MWLGEHISAAPLLSDLMCMTEREIYFKIPRTQEMRLLVSNPKPQSPLYHCRACTAEKGFQSSTVATFTPQYYFKITDVPPVLLQALSCVDTAMQVPQKYRAYAEGTAPPTSFLDSPMIRNALSAQQPEATRHPSLLGTAKSSPVCLCCIPDCCTSALPVWPFKTPTWNCKLLACVLHPRLLYTRAALPHFPMRL